MSRNEIHLDAMLRHLGAAYYDSTHGRASRSDVIRALDAIAEELDEKPSHHVTGRPRTEHAARAARRPRPLRRWARQVHDVMTTQVVTVDRITPYKEIARLLAEHKISGVPVLTIGRHVAGVVSEADLVAAEQSAARRTYPHRAWHRAGRQHQALIAEQLMTSPAITIRADAAIPSAARVMNTHHIRRLPVVDDEGKLVGIVSRRDLLTVFLRPDDEIADDVRQVLADFPDEEDGIVRTGVTVRDGVVTLTWPAGSGTSRPHGLAAAVRRLIWGVDGVVDIMNRTGSSAA